jgi:hypothetical protein
MKTRFIWREPKTAKDQRRTTTVKYIHLTALICVGVVAFAQEVQFDYDRSAHFTAYKTYRWIPIGDQLLDRNIKRAVDEQLAGKGLRRVESGADLVVGYQAAILHEMQFDSFGGWGPRWWGNWGSTRVTTSTIDIAS